MPSLHQDTCNRPHAQSNEGRLLLRRMVALGVAAEAIAGREPEMFQYLKRSCATCEYPAQCAGDLQDISAARASVSAFPGWDDYCPNAVLLNALSELPWFRATI